jgi:hypothetical protein
MTTERQMRSPIAMLPFSIEMKLSNTAPRASQSPSGFFAAPSTVSQPEAALAGDDRPTSGKSRTGRTKAYAVRARESFKGEVLRLQAEIQLERQLQSKAR